MKYFFRYILAAALSFCLLSCSMEEFGQHAQDDKDYIEFVVRPTSFSGYDVSTKAEDITALETALYTGYFMLFDSDGKRVFFQGADVVDDGLKLACRYYPTEELNVEFKDLSGYTACFIANVPYTFADGLTTLESLSTTPLPLAYADPAEAGYIGIPVFALDRDGNKEDDTEKTPCFPMFGIQPLDEAPTSNIVTLELRRLFAKVNLSVKLNLVNGVGAWNINTATFTVNNVTCSDLPKKASVAPGASDANSAWVNEGGIAATLKPDFTIYDQRGTGDTKDYNVTMYCPEIFLLPKENTSGETRTEQNKPQYYPDGTHPVNILIEGKFAHPNYSGSATIPFKYTLYLGENNIDNFSLARNKAYSYKMTITGIDEARLQLDERVEANIPIENLAKPEPANCYIISKMGRYSFPLVKGNSSESIGEIPHVNDTITTEHYEFILDKANASSDTKQIEISNLRYVDSTVDSLVFDVNLRDLKQMANGNAVLILKDANKKVLWSWHLWFYDLGFNTNGGISAEAYPNEARNAPSGDRLLDRCLGAPDQTGVGLYYQWGDKDPYFTSTAGTSTYHGGGDSNGAWSGTNKTVTDPCPPGYRVPSSDVWTSTNPDASKSTDDSYVYNMTVVDGIANIWYPYSGHYNSDGEKLDKIQKENSDITEGDYVLGYDDEIKVGDTYISIIPRLHLRCKEFEYKYNSSMLHGAMWSSDVDNKSSFPEALYYSYSGVEQSGIFSDIVITGCKYQKATIETTGPFIKKVSKITWSDYTYISAENMTGEHWSIAQANFKSSIQNEYIPKHNSEVGIYEYIPGSTSFSVSDGLQIRCVKE